MEIDEGLRYTASTSRHMEGRRMIKETLRRGSALSLLLALPVAVSAQGPFEGEWRYASACQFKHVANLSLKQSGNKVKGVWGDGTVIWGASGKLKGEVSDGMLPFKVCHTTNNRDESRCPAYQSADAFLQATNGKLQWYRTGGGQARFYMELERVRDGYVIAEDTDCGDEET